MGEIRLVINDRLDNKEQKSWLLHLERWSGALTLQNSQRDLIKYFLCLHYLNTGFSHLSCTYKQKFGKKILSLGLAHSKPRWMKDCSCIISLLKVFVPTFRWVAFHYDNPNCLIILIEFHLNFPIDMIKCKSLNNSKTWWCYNFQNRKSLQLNC